MANDGIAVFQRSIEACADPEEIARKVKLAFKRMPGEMALACFAKVMTAELPHPIKVAVWDAVRYSHIWWGVDEVLQGAVMDNPTVQQAFADAVPMRKWVVGKRIEGYEGICMTLGPEIVFTQGFVQSDLHRLIFLITHFSGSSSECENAISYPLFMTGCKEMKTGCKHANDRPFGPLGGPGAVFTCSHPCTSPVWRVSRDRAA